MTRLSAFTLFFAMLLVSCTHYFYSTNLNSLQLGTTKAEFLEFFGKGAEPPLVRAAQIGRDSVLTEVVTLNLLTPGASYATQYWFVFRAGRLAQWGRPEDWQAVAGRYEVSFNPGPSVRPD